MPKTVHKSISGRLVARLTTEYLGFARRLVLLLACLAPARAFADDTTIKILSATYGQSCGITVNNAGHALAAACDGKSTCFYRIQTSILGDPAYGCRKNFSAAYLCSGDPHPRQVSVPGEAGLGGTIQISCPSSGSAATTLPDAASALTTEPAPANMPDGFVRYLYQLEAESRVSYPDPSSRTHLSFFDNSLNGFFARDHAAGDNTLMRFDPLCQCQDNDGLHVLQITTESPSRGYTSSAVVDVKLGYAGPDQMTVTLVLSRSGLNQWQVSDISGPLSPGGIIAFLRAGFDDQQAKASTVAAAALHLSATPLQQQNCDRDDVRDAFLATFDQILNTPGQPWLNGGPLGALLGGPGLKLLQSTQGPESSAFLAVRAISVDASAYLSPAEVGPLQFEGTSLSRAGSLIMDAGQRNVPVGNYMFCRVDFNLKFTIQRPDRVDRLTPRRYEVPQKFAMLIMIPSDGVGVDKTMRLFGLMEGMLSAIGDVNMTLDRQLNQQ